MRGYGQFCPVARACEVLAERWTPLVLRELLCGSRRFNDLQRGVPLMSRTLLAQRLRELEDAGVITSAPKPKGRGREYHLTQAGEELRPIVERLGEWGSRWATRSLSPKDLDAGLLMWDIQRKIDVDRLPAERVVLRVDFRGVPRGNSPLKTWWLVLARPEVDLCLKDPGFDVDGTVDADLTALTRVWLGQVQLADMIRTGLITIEAPGELVKAFPIWLGLASAGELRRAAFTATPARP